MVAIFAAMTRDRLAVPVLVMIAWPVINGFLVDQYGELSWHGSSDLYRAMMLVLAGAPGLAVGEAHRIMREFATGGGWPPGGEVLSTISMRRRGACLIWRSCC